VTLGSDYPFPLRDPDPLFTIERQELSDAHQRAVCWGTAAELLGLERQTLEMWDPQAGTE
jgi:hypothetical protein